MAKKRTTKRKTARKPAKRKTARRATTRNVYVTKAAPKRKAARPTRKTATRKPRRIGNTMTKRKPSLMDAALEGLMSGAGQYAGAVVSNMIPLDGALAGGSVFVGGVALRKMGAPAAFASGMAGAGAVSAVGTFVALPGLNGGVSGGVGNRRRLSRREVEMIEAAAATDRIRGMKSETLHGNIVNRKTSLF